MNKVEPGMRFRGKITGRILRAIAQAEDGWWLSETEGTGERQRVLFGENNWDPIPEPAPEPCAFPRCYDAGSTREYQPVHGPCDGHGCVCDGKRQHGNCHDFVPPPAKAAKGIPSTVTGAAILPTAPGQDTEAARGGEAAVTKPAPKGMGWLIAQDRELGPSAVAAAVAREPWRPSVDEYDLLPDAKEGWRR